MLRYMFSIATDLSVLVEEVDEHFIMDKQSLGFSEVTLIFGNTRRISRDSERGNYDKFPNKKCGCQPPANPLSGSTTGRTQ